MYSTEVKVPTAENFYSSEQNLELDQNYQVKILAIKFQDSICLCQTGFRFPLKKWHNQKYNPVSMKSSDKTTM